LSGSGARARLLDQFRVVLRAPHASQQLLHRVGWRHVREVTSQTVRGAQRLLTEQQLLTARGTRVQIDRGEDALVGQLTGEDELAVARALELLEDHVVHARAGIDERGGEDRERTAALARIDLACAAQEALRLL